MRGNSIKSGEKGKVTDFHNSIGRNSEKTSEAYFSAPFTPSEISRKIRIHTWKYCRKIIVKLEIKAVRDDPKEVDTFQKSVTSVTSVTKEARLIESVNQPAKVKCRNLRPWRGAVLHENT